MYSTVFDPRNSGIYIVDRHLRLINSFISTLYYYYSTRYNGMVSCFDPKY